MTVPVCSGYATHMDYEGNPPTEKIFLSRGMRYDWPDLGSIFVVTACSASRMEIHGSGWVLAWTQDYYPEGEPDQHVRVWYRINSYPAPTIIDAVINLDPPGYGTVGLYDIPPMPPVNQGSSVLYPKLTEGNPELNRLLPSPLAEAGMGFVSERHPHASEEGGAVAGLPGKDGTNAV